MILCFGNGSQPCLRVSTVIVRVSHTHTHYFNYYLVFYFSFFLIFFFSLERPFKFAFNFPLNKLENANKLWISAVEHGLLYFSMQEKNWNIILPHFTCVTKNNIYYTLICFFLTRSTDFFIYIYLFLGRCEEILI